MITSTTTTARAVKPISCQRPTSVKSMDLSPVRAVSLRLELEGGGVAEGDRRRVREQGAEPPRAHGAHDAVVQLRVGTFQDRDLVDGAGRADADLGEHAVDRAGP